VPPDYFSATGQLWGNPQYDWTAMKEDGYGWWKARFRKMCSLVDIVRLDHFRGFEAYWEIDGKAKTAVNGCWRKGPGKAFFEEMEKAVENLSIVAEDLGIITDEVEKLRDDCGYPGMKVLHFCLNFNEMRRVGIAVPENSIVYTGTHDNNTTVGWFTQDLDAGVALLGLEQRVLEGEGQLVDLVEQRRGHVRGDEVEALAHVQGGGRPEDRRVAQPVRDRAGVQREALLVVRAAAAGVLLLLDRDEFGGFAHVLLLRIG